MGLLALILLALGSGAGYALAPTKAPSPSQLSKSIKTLRGQVAKLQEDLERLNHQINADWSVPDQAYGIRHVLLRVCQWDCKVIPGPKP